MDKPVIILGASGIGKAALEIFQSHGILIYCFLDDHDDLQGTDISGISILGQTDDESYLKFIGHKCEAFVATDDNEERKAQVKLLVERRKVMPVNAIHKNAHLSPTSSIAHGNFIDNAVVFGADVIIGNHNLIHTGAIIEYNTKIGDYVRIGSGSIIGSDVIIENEVFIGSGVLIVAGLRIGKSARIGAGSVVVNDIKSSETVFGNPAKSVNV